MLEFRMTSFSLNTCDFMNIPELEGESSEMKPCICSASSSVTFSLRWRMASGVLCAAVNCNNYRASNLSLSFFRFPKELTRCQVWLNNCRRTDLDELFKIDPLYLYRNCRLCATHFEDEHFVNPVLKNKLRPNAVPTLFNVPNPSQKLSIKCKNPLQQISSQKNCQKSDSIENDFPQMDIIIKREPEWDESTAIKQELEFEIACKGDENAAIMQELEFEVACEDVKLENKVYNMIKIEDENKCSISV